MVTLKDYETEALKHRINQAFNMLDSKSEVEKTYGLRDGEFYPFMCGWLHGELVGVLEYITMRENRR